MIKKNCTIANIFGYVVTILISRRNVDRNRCKNISILYISKYKDFLNYTISKISEANVL